MALVEEINQNEQLNSQVERCDEDVALNPDHPLMRRFQNAMHVHLQQQEQLIFDELKDLKSKVNYLDKEREQLGEELYGFQQEIGKQQNLLDGFQERYSSLATNRIEKEKIVNSLQEKIKAEIDKNNLATKKDYHYSPTATDSATLKKIGDMNVVTSPCKMHKKILVLSSIFLPLEGELRHEKDKLTVLHNHFMELKNEMENNITISQHVQNKTQTDKNRLIEEKKKQDLLMLKITIEFFKLKHQITELDTFTKLKEEEKAVMDLTLADANADLEALTVEQNNLMKAWQGAILNVKQRDQIYFQIVDEVRELKLKLCNLNGEIEGVKKASNKEMEKNEELTLLLHKAETTLENLKTDIVHLQEKENNHNLELSKLTFMLQQTEKDLQVAVMVSNQRENERIAVRKKIENLAAQQISLEDQIMNTLQSQITQDKSAKHLHKIISKIKETVREQEVQLSHAENTMANSLLAIEQQNAENERILLNVEDLRYKLNAAEKEIAQANDELQNSITILGKKQNALDLLNKRLEKLLSLSGGVELSSQEIKILSLQSEIKEINAKCEKLKVLWIRHQGSMVELTQERNEQLKKIDTYRKEVNLLMQKNLKLRNDVDKTVKEGEIFHRLIKNHQQKLSQLCLKFSEKKGSKETLGKNNLIIQNDFLNSLKDAESEYLQLKSVCEELKLEREKLKEELLTAQRTSLSWEKKIQMVIETRQALDKENSADGDISTMKGEIHRMEVRLGQLYQVQERLAGDLEKCVTRRETITYAARVREKKGTDTTAHQIQTRISIKRKTEELHRRIKLVTLEIKSIEHQLSNGKDQMTQLRMKLSERQDRVLKMKKAVDEIIADIAEKRMKKLQNLEDLVRSQQLVRKYQDMKEGRYRPQCTSEATLQTEMQGHLKTNSDVTEVIKGLKDDFPSHSLSLSRIGSSLEIKSP